MKENTNQFLNLLWEAVAEKKGIDPVILDLRAVSGVADYFLICSGNSPVQVKAITDNIGDKLKEAELSLALKEGYQTGRWVLMDFGDVVVHIMHQEEREFYALEKLWHDATQIWEL